MELEYNPHQELVKNYYFKFNVLNNSNSKNIQDSIKSIKKQNESSKTQIEFNWMFPSITNDKFIVPSIDDNLMKQDLNKLNNYSFIHSILYLIDNVYYASSVEQKLRDCREFLELFRSKIYKDKLNKELSDIIKNLENNVYIDNTIQAIVNYLDSFHLLILSNEAPKLFINGKTKKNNPQYNSAGTLVIIYYDHLREVYSPLEYNMKDESTLYISWKEKEFLQMLKKVHLYNHPKEIKKWAVADLREWIRFFNINIDIKLEKKEIIEKMGDNAFDIDIN